MKMIIIRNRKIGADRIMVGGWAGRVYGMLSHPHVNHDNYEFGTWFGFPYIGPERPMGDLDQ